MAVNNPGGGGSNFTQGTLAARPAVPAPNQLYFATDTGEWWVGNAAGNAWQSLSSTSSSIFNIIPNGGSFRINGGTQVMSADNNGFNFNSCIKDGNAAPAYGVTVTPGVQSWETITVTNATAFTVAAPFASPSAAQHGVMVIEIFNNSGGVMGAITWNATYKLVGGAFTNPANGLHRYIKFEWNGANWIETGRATADY